MAPALTSRKDEWTGPMSAAAYENRKLVLWVSCNLDKRQTALVCSLIIIICVSLRSELCTSIFTWTSN